MVVYDLRPVELVDLSMTCYRSVGRVDWSPTDRDSFESVLITGRLLDKSPIELRPVELVDLLTT